MHRIGRIRFGCAALGLVLAVSASGAGAQSQSSPVWVSPDIAGGRAAAPDGRQLDAVYPSAGPQRYRLPFNRPGAGVRPLTLSPPQAETLRRVADPSPAPSAPPPPPARAEAPTAPREAPVPPPKPAALTTRTETLSSETLAPEAPAPAPRPAAPAAVERRAPAPVPPATPATTVAAERPAPPPVEKTMPTTPPPMREVAAAAPAALPDDTYRLVFQGGQVEIDAAGERTLAAIASQLQGTGDRIQIMAYADDPNETTDWKRRVSLKRAQNARKVLLAHDVQSFRILVRALGQPGDGGPGNRVDVTIGTR